MNDYTLPTEICKPSHILSQQSSVRQEICERSDSGVFGIRPVSAWQSQRISFTGGQICKIRRPDLGETGLSQCEIDHAELHGISA